MSETSGLFYGLGRPRNKVARHEAAQEAQETGKHSLESQEAAMKTNECQGALLVLYYIF